MIALGEQVQVDVAQLRAEAVGVFRDLLAAGPVDVQLIGMRFVQVCGEQARQCTWPHVGQHALVVARQHAGAQGIGQVGTNGHAPCWIGVRPQYRKRIGVLGARQGIQVPLPKPAVFTR